MKQQSGAKKWVKFAVRWGVAVAGITYVLWHLNFSDRLKVLDPATNQLADLQVLGDPPQDAPAFRTWGRLSGESAATERLIPRHDVWTSRSDRTSVEVHLPDGPHAFTVAGIRPAGVENGSSYPAEILVRDPSTKAQQVIDPARVVSGWQVPTYPLVDIGLRRMTREADWKYLLAALAVMPIVYVLTSYRWHLLMDVLGIRMSQGRTFAINMVGCFYNSFMPGSTGGDLVKAYYASKHTTHRTRAVMSVLVDRAMGLVALIILGGAMAAFQFNQSVDCKRVALASAGLIALTVLGLIVFYHHGLRRATGLAWVLSRLPMQKFVQNAVHTMDLYGRRPGAMLYALALCFPVHITTIVSATFAGMAFGLKLPPAYYWVIVPVIALVGAIPISPQGAGVMEFFAIKLMTLRHPVTVGQAVALVMCMRLTQIVWNLVAGVFVLRGDYHAPTAAEAHELEEDEADDEDAEGNPEPAATEAAPKPVVETGGLSPLGRGLSLPT